jgi:hypothetical protein
VKCAGKHYCKRCVASGDAITLRMGFKRDWRARPPVLLGVDWLMKRWPAILLLLLGIVTLSSALLCMSLVGNAASNYTYQYSANSLATSYRSWSGVPISRMAMSIWMQVGALFLAGSVLMLARRFGLRWLMTAVLLVGVVGALPFMLIKGEPHLTQSIRIIAPVRLQQSDLQQLQTQFDPKVAMNTVPQAMLDELQLKPGEGVSRVDLELNHHGREIVFNVEYSDTLSPHQRATLEDFYRVYAATIVFKQNNPNTALPSSGLGDLPYSSSGDSNWSLYADKWLAQNAQQGGAVAH